MRAATPTVSLYLLSVIGSGCGFVTQMLVSGYWSTTFSQDVYHFSVNLAFYFLSLGVGSLWSAKWKAPDLKLLFEIVCLLCLWTGLSIPLLRTAIIHSGNLTVVPLFAVSVAGVLAGNVVPLTLRVGAADPRMKLSTLFFLDYTAAILFTLLFTFVCLVPLGYGLTAVVLSGMCLGATAVLMFLNRIRVGSPVVLAVLGLLVPYPAHRASLRHDAPRMSASGGPARVVLSRQSHYQKIVVTEEDTDPALFPGVKNHVLYLDGFVQFSSIDEQNYHVCIVNIPVAAAEFQGNPVRKALVLGGGDGLAARNLVAFPNVKEVVLVELDPEMIRIARNEPSVLLYNLNALADPRVKVVAEDAFRWVRESAKSAPGQFDLIVVDFPAPKNVTLSRLFSAEFYRDVLRLLEPKGMVAIQAGPSFSFDDPEFMTLSEVTSSVRRSLAAVGGNAHVYASSRDEDAFVLGTPDPAFDMAAFAKKVGIVGHQAMGYICTWNPDWKESEVRVNTLNTLVLSRYMLAWFHRAGGPFFNYRGSRGVFLPD